MALVFVAMLLASIMDVLGIVSVMPFIAFLAKPEVESVFPFVEHFRHFLGLEGFRETAFALGAVVLTTLLTANAINAVATWLLIRAIAMRMHTFSVRLLGHFMAQEYEFFFRRNSAELSHRALHQVARVVSGLFFPAILVAARSLQVAVIFALLIAINAPLAIGIALVFGAVFVGAYQMFKQTISRAGRRASESGAARQRTSGEALAGAKEITLLGRGRWFLERYANASLAASRSEIASQAAAQLPRYALESLLFGGMIAAALVLLAFETDMDRVVPLMSLYAFAGYRIMPGLQQIFVNYSALRFNRSVLDDMRADMAMAGGDLPLARPMQVPMGLRNELRLVNVEYRYPTDTAETITNLNLTVKARTVVGLAGSSGSGKSTIVNLLGALLYPTRGRMEVDGKQVTPENANTWRRTLGYVSQDIFLIDDTIAGNIALGIPEAERDMVALERAARLSHLHEFILSELPDGYATKIGENGVRLSGGQRQRIGIARALYHDPDLLIFDEATSALDNLTERAIMDDIATIARTKTVVLVAHRLSTLKDCNVIYLVEGGRVVANGTYDELITGNERFRSLAAAGATTGQEKPQA